MKFLYLNFKHIRCLIIASEKGSISKAAEAVHLSQPAITQAITKIEQLLDCTLFERNRKGLFPTEAGQRLIARGRRAEQHLAEGFRLATRGTESEIQRLVNGATTTQLRALIQLSESGSYSLAGRALNIAHSSVHRSIRDLENWSGIKVAEPSRMASESHHRH